MNGFQVAQALRQSPETAGIPISVMSALFNKEEHSQMMDLYGIKVGLKKPFRPIEVLKVIEKALIGPVKD